AVPVEVVRLEVEQHGDVAGEGLDVLELERRELAHDPGAGADGAERGADVPGHRDVATRGAEDGAQELDGGRLPVRARDADEPRAARQEAVPELDLRPHRDPALARGRD